MHTVKLFAALGALTLAAGLASADAVTGYTSLVNWDSAVSNVNNYTIQDPGVPGWSPNNPTIPVGDVPYKIGAGTFNAGTIEGRGQGYIYNDGLYGSGVSYFSDDPGQQGNTIASVTVAFSASQDVTAASFSIGTEGWNNIVDVLVNGSYVENIIIPLGQPAGTALDPEVFVGITDSLGPITNITFVDGGPGPNSTNFGEMDVIGSYNTATLIAPEIDPTSAASGLTLLLGGLAVLRARRGKIESNSLQLTNHAAQIS